MKAHTLANALTLIRRLRQAAAQGGPVEFYPHYSLACQCELELEDALTKLDAPIEKEKEVRMTKDQPSSRSEPVAWRYRLRSKKPHRTALWRYVDSPEEVNPSPEYEKQALYLDGRTTPFAPVSELQERWIPVGERLPDHDGDVLGFYQPAGVVRVECAIYGGGNNGLEKNKWYRYDESHYPYPVPVTHWQELPNAPSEREET